MQTIPLHGKLAAGRVALVDDEDYELVSRYRWRLHATHQTDYAQAWNGPRVIRMHVLIMGQPGIDHRDGDGLNCQRYNLRVATTQQNVCHQRPVRGGTSQFKGVSWHKQTGRWRAYIQIAGRQHHLGYFADEIEAAKAYDEAARIAWGEYAWPNIP